MDYKEAFSILKINLNETDYKDITLDFLKKKYHQEALRHHPDKNLNIQEESTQKFKKINEAYHFLKKELKNINNSCEMSSDNEFYNEDEDDENEDSLHLRSWENILKMFMSGILDGKYMESFSKIITEIVSGYKTISAKLFEGLNKDSLLELYTFLSKHRSTFRLSDEILESIKEIVLHKYDNVEVYKLNPSIYDLLNNNVYKLYANEELFLVPLWHNELYFENSNKEIIVFCEPELPDNIKIDDDNNIYTEININFQQLYSLIIRDKHNHKSKVDFYVGDRAMEIPISDLLIKREQFYRIKNQGISKIIENDIYNTTHKGDIIVKITIL
jgi:curved DNA-binding protein CbpA